MPCCWGASRDHSRLQLDRHHCRAFKIAVCLFYGKLGINTGEWQWERKGKAYSEADEAASCKTTWSLPSQFSVFIPHKPVMIYRTAASGLCGALFSLPQLLSGKSFYNYLEQQKSKRTEQKWSFVFVTMLMSATIEMMHVFNFHQQTLNVHENVLYCFMKQSSVKRRSPECGQTEGQEGWMELPWFSSDNFLCTIKKTLPIIENSICRAACAHFLSPSFQINSAQHQELNSLPHRTAGGRCLASELDQSIIPFWNCSQSGVFSSEWTMWHLSETWWRHWSEVFISPHRASNFKQFN